MMFTVDGQVILQQRETVINEVDALRFVIVQNQIGITDPTMGDFLKGKHDTYVWALLKLRASWPDQFAIQLRDCDELVQKQLLAALQTGQRPAYYAGLALAIKTVRVIALRSFPDLF